jgi:tetratricopeptide (TPR) repeat protein
MKLISDWVHAPEPINPALGMSVDAAFASAHNLRDKLRENSSGEFGLEDQETMADVLHAVCRTLLSDVAASPQAALAEARALHVVLQNCYWPKDEFEERETLLRSLAFISWRASRLLGLSRESQRWEARYRQLFRASLQKEVIDGTLFVDAIPSSSTLLDVLGSDVEDLFQTLLCLQDRADKDPETIARQASQFYRKIEMSVSRIPFDLHLYLLGGFARLTASALKHGADQQAAGEWLDLAEDHFRAGVNPEPELARAMFIRLAIFYTIERLDLVLRVAPTLDTTFASYGMEEDRVKGRILWSSTLKAIGRLEEAFELLQPLRQSRPDIRPALYGYILRECGDLHLIWGDYRRGLAELREASSVLKAENELTALPGVVGMIGFAYRAQGMLREAVEFFIESQKAYAELGMRPYESYTGLLVAETLLAMDRSKEAELVVLSVLPSIEAQGMVADGIAAINLLREALRRQKLNPQMLRELRERLRPSSK